MIRRILALCLLSALAAGCGSADGKPAAQTRTPAPPPPTAAPDVPNKKVAKPRPPAPPRLAAPK